MRGWRSPVFQGAAPPRFSRLRFNLALAFSTLVVLATISAWWVERQLSGPLVEWARHRATNIATAAINEAVGGALAGRLEAVELLRFDGRPDAPALIRYNMGQLNPLISDAVRAILEAVESYQPEEFRVPTGQLSGMQVFAGWGPSIPVRILTTGAVVAEPKVDFVAAGINQVAHRLYLDVEVRMMIVAPLVRDEIIVRQPVILAEELYQGEVPQTYVHLVGFRGGLAEWMSLVGAPGDGSEAAGSGFPAATHTTR